MPAHEAVDCTGVRRVKDFPGYPLCRRTKPLLLHRRASSGDGSRADVDVQEQREQLSKECKMKSTVLAHKPVLNCTGVQRVRWTSQDTHSAGAQIRSCCMGMRAVVMGPVQVGVDGSG